MKPAERTKALKPWDDHPELRKMMNKEIISEVEAGKVTPAAAKDFIFARMLRKYGKSS